MKKEKQSGTKKCVLIYPDVYSLYVAFKKMIMHHRPFIKMILLKMKTMPQEMEEEVDCSTENQMAT